MRSTVSSVTTSTVSLAPIAATEREGLVDYYGIAVFLVKDLLPVTVVPLLSCP